MTCSICAYAAVHGWWGPDHRGSHCGDGCHRSWAGLKEAHCPVCHLHFSTDKIADKHRQAGRCLTLSELRRLRTEAGKPVVRVVDTPNGEIVRSAETLRLKPDFAGARV